MGTGMGSMVLLRANAARAISSTSPASVLRVRPRPPPLALWSQRANQKEADRIASCWARSTCTSVGPPIDVIVTKGSGSVPPEDEISSPQISSTSTPKSVTEPIKPNDRIVEEGILTLQSELRVHHRHAAYGSALAKAKELLERASTHFGDNHPATASAHNNVGLMNKMLGNYSEAKEAYHKSLRIYGEVVGKDHASYAAALSNLGMLERGRVLESEAEASQTDKDNADGAASNFIDDDISDLEELREGNSPESVQISALERMQLNESAIEYFDEAYSIRLSELGPDHPHTVTSRSQLGSAMAAAVIAERRGRIGGLVEAELRRLKNANDLKDAKEMEAFIPEAVSRAAAKSSSPSRLTRRRWEAAEEHLRGALAAAVESPRGESVSPLMFIPVKDGPADGESKGLNGQGLTLPTKKGQKLTKKEQKRLDKERLRERRRATKNALLSMKGKLSERNIGEAKIAVQGAAGKVTTLSAATAAQNLAVFLKNFSDWLRLAQAEKGDAQKEQIGEAMRKLYETVDEARHLYESALHVRSSVLPPHHPEVVATRFSLSELLDLPRGLEGDAIDGNRANTLREEILNAYNVEERTDVG